MPNQIKLEMTPNTPENAEDLSYGDAYLVEYIDVKEAEKRLMIGTWQMDGFSFPAARTRPKPAIENTGENYITGWCRVKDWRP